MLGLDLKAAGIAGLVGLILGGIGVDLAHRNWFDPALVASTTESVTEQVAAKVTAERDSICLASSAKAAAMARSAAEQRQAEAIDAALAAYRKSAEQSARASAAEKAELESEIRDYEQRLEKLGQLWPLGPDDYRFIYGNSGLQFAGPEDGQ